MQCRNAAYQNTRRNKQISMQININKIQTILYEMLLQCFRITGSRPTAKTILQIRALVQLTQSRKYLFLSSM